MHVLAGHPAPIVLGRTYACGIDVFDQGCLNDFGVAELLIEMARKQQHRVFQLRSLEESARSRKFADHHAVRR